MQQFKRDFAFTISYLKCRRMQQTTDFRKSWNIGSEASLGKSDHIVGYIGEIVVAGQIQSYWK